MISLMLDSKDANALKTCIECALSRIEDNLKYDMHEEQRSKNESIRDRLHNMLVRIYNDESKL